MAKPVTDFYTTTYGKSGRRGTCKTCTRLGSAQRRIQEIRRVNLARYGMTIEQYDEMHRGQAGRCAVCHEPETALSRNGTPFRLAVDHHHATGKIRGLLCGRCNRVVGHIESRADLLDRINWYLTQHNAPNHYGVPPGCTYDESIAAHRSMCPIDHGAQHNADSAGGGFRTRLDDRGYSTSEPRNPDSVSICYCDGAGRHIRGENCVARPAADPA